MYECKKGHTFCREHAVDGEELEDNLTKLADNEDEEDTDSYYDAIHEVPAKHCPCCTFGAVSQYDLIDYLLKKTGMDKEAVAEELKEKFKDFGEFREYLKEKEYGKERNQHRNCRSTYNRICYYEMLGASILVMVVGICTTMDQCWLNLTHSWRGGSHSIPSHQKGLTFSVAYGMIVVWVSQYTIGMEKNLLQDNATR